MLVVGAVMSTSKLAGGAGTEAEAEAADGVEAEAAGLSVLEDDDGTAPWTGLPRR
jgi:hypothetical protein